MTEQEIDLIAKQFRIFPNFPNPFNPETQLKYQIDGNAGEQFTVSVAIYDILGQQVVSLVDEEQEAGVYVVTWNGADALGNTASGGIYFAVYQFGEFTYQTQKLILAK